MSIKGWYRVWPLWVKASRWPWQEGYNWRGMTNSMAPLNPRGARFGAGWRWCLGIEVGTNSMILNLLFGMIHVSWREPYAVQRAREQGHVG